MANHNPASPLQKLAQVQNWELKQIAGHLALVKHYSDKYGLQAESLGYLGALDVAATIRKHEHTQERAALKAEIDEAERNWLEGDPE